MEASHSFTLLLIEIVFFVLCRPTALNLYVSETACTAAGFTCSISREFPALFSRGFGAHLWFRLCSFFVVGRTARVQRLMLVKLDSNRLLHENNVRTSSYFRSATHSLRRHPAQEIRHLAENVHFVFKNSR